jgi:protein TonB
MISDSLIESRRYKVDSRKLAILPFVIGLHVLVLAIFVISSIWHITYIEEPPIKVTLFTAPPPPPAAKPKSVQEEARPQPQANVAPTNVPEYRPDVSQASVGEVEGAVEGGFDWGWESGYGSAADGVPGGIPEGVPVPKPPEEEVVRIGVTVQGELPVLVSKVEPEYPEIAKKARIEGIVVLEAIINKDGTVGNIKVLRSLNPILDQAAIKAVKQWKYIPGKVNGKPVNSYLTVTVRFILK